MKKINEENFILAYKAILTHRFWKPLCLLLMNTHMEINYVLNLKWQDINFDRQLILTNDNNYPFSYELLEVLKSHKNFKEREQKRLQNKYSYTADSDLVFGNTEGGLRSFSGTSHIFRKFLHRHNIKNTTLNCFKWFNYQKTKTFNKLDEIEM